jgi:hypothetical protein
MAEFISFNKNVEVSAEGVLSFVNSMEKGKENRLLLLSKYGIIPEPGGWYNLQKWLDAFKELAIEIGEMNVFLVGKAAIVNAKFPPMDSLKEALESINIAYHMNHRLDGKIMFDSKTGKITEGIGNYILKSYNEDTKKAVMFCENPYPSKFDEGLLTQIVRIFKPKGGPSQNVFLDSDMETRRKGKDSCTYNIIW